MFRSVSFEQHKMYYFLLGYSSSSSKKYIFSEKFKATQLFSKLIITFYNITVLIEFLIIEMQTWVSIRNLIQKHWHLTNHKLLNVVYDILIYLKACWTQSDKNPTFNLIHWLCEVYLFDFMAPIRRVLEDFIRGSQIAISKIEGSIMGPNNHRTEYLLIPSALRPAGGFH